MTLEKDSFWDCVVGAETFESFKENYVPKFKFKAHVSDDVIKSFKIVEKLITHSYFEYDFLDPALTKALTSFELALKQRYEELNKKKWKGTLQNLLYYFNEAGYFEFFRKELMDALRNTRNRQSHPTTHFGGGFGLMVIFMHCLDLINDTYEDLELRKLRLKEKNMVNCLINEVLQSGGILTRNNIPFTIYESKVFFINNTPPGKVLYGYYKCIFDLKNDHGKVNYPYVLDFFAAIDYEYNHKTGAIKFYGINELLEIDAITDSENESQFGTWHDQYKATKEYLMYNVELNYKIDKYWGLLRRALHLIVKRN